MSIRESGRPLVDLTRDDEAGPSGMVKEEKPTNEPADPRGKHDVVHEDDYNFYQDYDRFGR
jgi:hypothetical protein